MKHDTESSFIITVVLIVLLVGVTWIYRMVKAEIEEKAHAVTMPLIEEMKR